MNVPFLDLRAAYVELESEINQAVLKSMRSGWYILGPEVDAFEKQFAQYCEADHAIGVIYFIGQCAVIFCGLRSHLYFPMVIRFERI